METDKAKMEHRTAIFKMLNWFLKNFPIAASRPVWAMLYLQLSSQLS
jgi:hypothetical protein